MVFEEKKIEIAAWLLDPDRKKPPRRPLAVLEQEIKKSGLDKVYREIELPLVEVLQDIGKIGIKINALHLKKLSGELQKEITKLEREIYRFAGGEFNINSTQQLSRILFDDLGINSKNLKRTKSGLVSTNEGILQAIRDQHEIVEHILRYRELFKLKSTYTDPLPKLADQNGRIHTTFLQTGAATGRLASRQPNLQNIPASGEWAKKIRSAFIADRGFTLVALDYSQFELRILASISGDQNMITAFNKDQDIHALTAALVYGVPLNKVTAAMRRTAKTLNFGISYGMGAVAFAKTSGLSQKEARAFIDKYFENFSAIKTWQETAIREARKRGYVENLNGRKRRLLHINDHHNPWLRAEAERVVINMPMQGLQADIMKMAMAQIARELKRRGLWQKSARLLLTIHDELIFEIQDRQLKKIIPIIKDVMTTIYTLKVPIKVNVSSGKSWGTLQ